MNVLQFNILEGCHEEKRFKQFSEWILKQNYDVVGFNELNGWTGDTFQQATNKWGYKHSFIFEMETSPYFVGVMSKFPIEVIRCDEKAFYHGLLHVKTNNVHFFIAHLTPFESTYREKETEKITEYVKLINEPVVVMGDLNTLSPLDHHYYELESIADYLATKEILSNQHLVEGKINYRPMQILLDAGLHDVGFNDRYAYSMPTPLKHNVKNVKQLRIDYVLVNTILLESMPIATILHNQEVEILSDHYPIECRWKSIVIRAEDTL